MADPWPADHITSQGLVVLHNGTDVSLFEFVLCSTKDSAANFTGRYDEVVAF